MSLFSDFAKRHFAKELGIPAEQVERVYSTVLETFHIEVTNSKWLNPNNPETFSACLTCVDDEDNTVKLIRFANPDGTSEFASAEEAFEAALSQVNNVKLCKGGDLFISVLKDIPQNALMLFDPYWERQRFSSLYLHT